MHCRPQGEHLQRLRSSPLSPGLAFCSSLSQVACDGEHDYDDEEEEKVADEDEDDEEEAYEEDDEEDEHDV